MHVVFFTHRNDPNGELETVETGKVALTPDGLVVEGDGADWMNMYPKGLIAVDVGMAIDSVVRRLPRLGMKDPYETSL